MKNRFSTWVMITVVLSIFSGCSNNTDNFGEASQSQSSVTESSQTESLESSQIAPKTSESLTEQSEEDVPVFPIPSQPQVSLSPDIDDNNLSERESVGVVEYETWKIKMAEEYGASDFGKWQDEVHRVAYDIKNTLGEDIYASVEGIIIPYEGENDFAASSCYLGYKYYVVDETYAKKIADEKVASYNTKLGPPIDIQIIPWDFNYTTLDGIRNEIYEQSFYGFEMIKGIGIEDGKIYILASTDCSELEKFLENNDYAKYVTLYKKDFIGP